MSSVQSGDCMVDNLRDTDDATNAVNERHDALFTERNGKRCPCACSICDEFMGEDRETASFDIIKKCYELLSWSGMPDARRTVELEAFYRFNDNMTMLGTAEDTAFLKDLALSPRGAVCKKKTARKPGSSACTTCENALDHGRRPQFAIVNGFYVGGAPKCLTDLTEVELAFLTPVKHHGCCFAHVGGGQALLKGTLTFMKVEKKSMANSTCTLNAMGLDEHAPVVLAGQLTKKQKNRAVEKAATRTEHVTRAMDWLHQNHVDWKHVDIESLKAALDDEPVAALDHSEEVESSGSNIEKEEAFTCFHPDGAHAPEKGGFDDADQFKKCVEDMAHKGFDVEFQTDLKKTYVQAGDSDVLVNSSLLQFPCGIGGTDEARAQTDGSSGEHMDVQQHFKHLSRLSQEAFHKDVFQLIMHGMLSKHRLLARSRLKLKTPADAESVASGLNPVDLHHAVLQRRHGNRFGGTNVSRKSLDAVDACAQGLPHANEASRKARADGEAMQHHLGTASMLLTMTFDDENSSLMQSLAGVEIDDDAPLDSLTCKDWNDRAKERQHLRLRCPGVASLNHETLMKTLIDEVVGWDMENDCPTENPGACGATHAFQLGTEEQGRKTSHGHMCRVDVFVTVTVKRHGG